jgi:hypothetical protein
MVARFSLYDFIAVVVPGIFTLWAAKVLTGATALQTISFSGGIAETSVLIVIGYVVGLLMQGVSQHVTEQMLVWQWDGFPSARWLLPDDKRLSNDYKMHLAGILKQKYNLVLNMDPIPADGLKDRLKRNQELFYTCYRAVEKKSELPATFVAQYGLFRSLLTIFLLLTISVAAINLNHVLFTRINYNELGTLIVLILATVVSYLRVKKRADDFAKSVYDTFVANYGSNP